MFDAAETAGTRTPMTARPTSVSIRSPRCCAALASTFAAAISAASASVAPTTHGVLRTVRSRSSSALTRPLMRAPGERDERLLQRVDVRQPQVCAEPAAVEDEDLVRDLLHLGEGMR